MEYDEIMAAVRMKVTQLENVCAYGFTGSRATRRKRVKEITDRINELLLLAFDQPSTEDHG